MFAYFGVFFVQPRCALQLKILESIWLSSPVLSSPVYSPMGYPAFFLTYGLPSPILLINPWADVKNMWALQPNCVDQSMGYPAQGYPA